MTSTLTIGDFSRATHLSVKMLRHYHELGVLEPVDVDVGSGYRRYAAEQIVTAQIIRRFRDLDMPLDDIHAVLQAPDVETRNRVIVNHLARLESSLARTQETVASLRGLLDRPQDSSVPIDHRRVAAAPAAVITDIVEKAEVVAWYRGAMGEVAATLSAQDINPAGPLGGIFDTELFTEDRGRATIFLPCDPLPQPVGRVSATVIPPAELATVANRSWMADLPNPAQAITINNCWYEMRSARPKQLAQLPATASTQRTVSRDNRPGLVLSMPSRAAGE